MPDAQIGNGLWPAFVQPHVFLFALALVMLVALWMPNRLRRWLRDKSSALA